MKPDLKEALRPLANSLATKINDVDSKIEALTLERRELILQIDAVRTLLQAGTSKEDEPISLVNMGFRDAVRAILKDSPDGLTTGEIRKQLSKRGYVYTASTPLPVRISNETRRMQIQGMIERRGKRNFLTEKGRNM